MQRWMEALWCWWLLRSASWVCCVATFSQCCARDILQEPPLTFGIMRKDRDNIINKYGWWNKIKKNAEGLLDYLFSHLSLCFACLARAHSHGKKMFLGKFLFSLWCNLIVLVGSNYRNTHSFWWDYFYSRIIFMILTFLLFGVNWIMQQQSHVIHGR
jgi:hypothetical protein